MSADLPEAAPGPWPPVEPRGGVFPATVDRYGVRLALVFGNHAPRGECPYYTARLCKHCDIGAGEGAAFDLATNRLRLRWFRERYADTLGNVVHLAVYNSGSVLNPVELPEVFLDELAAFARSLPALKFLSVESREAYVTAARVERLAQALGASRALRVIVGLESASDRVRDRLLDKKMPRQAVDRAFEALASAARAAPDRVGIAINILVAAPGTTPRTAVRDAAATARYALSTGHALGLSVDLNLHPYYPSAVGQAAFPEHPRCSTEVLARATAAVDRVRAELLPESRLFVGLEDEGHDQNPSGQRQRAAVRAAVDRFNASGDVSELRPLQD